jgi:hypothetical protein
MLLLYTDGLIERRDQDLDDGIDDLATTCPTWAASTPVRCVRQSWGPQPPSSPEMTT